MNEKERLVLRLLLDEYRRYNKDIQRLLSLNDKIGSLWITLIIVAFGVGLKDDVHQIFLLLPVVIFTVFFYTINVYELIMTTGGNIAALEDKINYLVGAKVFVWESELSAQLQHFRFSTAMIMLFSVGASLGIVVYSVYDVYAYYGGWVFWVELSGASISTVVALILLYKLRDLHGETKKFIEKNSARSRINKESLTNLDNSPPQQ